MLVAAIGIAATVVGPAPAAASPVVVSLNFDDSTASQYAVRPLLAARGLEATFYVNSGRLGTPGSMTWAQVRGLAADGHEIGGHTLSHVDLTEVDPAEARRQVCDDRSRLVSEGFDPVSFAYPFGAFDASIASIVRQCGYSTARMAWGLGPWAPPYAESLPPPDIWAIRAEINFTASTSLDQMKLAVTLAEDNGGGWVPLVFHEICDGCNTFSTQLSTLAAFLDWLQARSASGTVVRTMAATLGLDGTAPPDLSAPSVVSGLSAVAAGPSQVDLSWSAATDSGGSGVAGYRVERCAGFGCGSFVQVAAPAGTSYSDSGLAAASVYRYRVRAVDGAGNLGGYSAVVSATTDTPPDPAPPPGPAPSVPPPSPPATVPATGSVAAAGSGPPLPVDAQAAFTPPVISAVARLPRGLTRSGSARGEILRGTSLGDRLNGRGGADKIYGYAGGDTLTGGRGRDVVEAGEGDDVIHVRDGERDLVRCGPGRDTVVADRLDRLVGCDIVEYPAGSRPRSRSARADSDGQRREGTRIDILTASASRGGIARQVV